MVRIGTVRAWGLVFATAAVAACHVDSPGVTTAKETPAEALANEAPASPGGPAASVASRPAAGAFVAPSVGGMLPSSDERAKQGLARREGVGHGQFALAPLLPGPAVTAAGYGGAGLLAAKPLSPSDPVASDVPAAATLDPNARYATTYRPGGAALAAFDAALGRGQIPATYRDLVGDFGARYAPALAAPPEGALALDVHTARAAVGPGGGSMNLAVVLASTAAQVPRAPLSVHVVLDTSGSMAGGAIEDAKAAAAAVVEKLAPGDDFSMVTFSNDARLLVPDGRIGERRAAVEATIHGVRADGGTNISAGLDLAYVQAHAGGAGPDAVRLVMLLSDGHANGGDTRTDGLADRASRAFQDGIQTSAFGLGSDFDAALMSKIADRGAGGYYYLADSSQIAGALATEIDARLRPVATAVELRVRLRPDVTPTHVYGSHELSAIEARAVREQEVAIDRHEASRGVGRDRQSDAEGGMRFFLPAFARDDRHTTMITLRLPPGDGERGVASVELRYKDRVLGRNVTRELPVKMRWAASDAESATTEDRSIEPAAQAFAAGEAILAAAERVDAGDRAGAQQILDERAELLGRAAQALDQPRLAEDGARLARLATAVGGGAGSVRDPLPLVVMLRGAGYGYL